MTKKKVKCHKCGDTKKVLWVCPTCGGGKVKDKDGKAILCPNDECWGEGTRYIDCSECKNK